MSTNNLKPRRRFNKPRFTKCTLWAQRTHRGKMSDVTVGFMPRPRRHSAQSADSRAWGFTEPIRTQRSFRLVNGRVEINNHRLRPTTFPAACCREGAIIRCIKGAIITRKHKTGMFLCFRVINASKN